MYIALGRSAGVASYRSDTFAAEGASNAKERRKFAARETHTACSAAHDETQLTGPELGFRDTF
jgi:hypothetical protein